MNDPQSAYLLLLMCGSATMRTCGHAFVRFLVRRMPRLVRTPWRPLHSRQRSESAPCCTSGELGRFPSHAWSEQRHPAVAERMIDGLQANAPLTCLQSVGQCRQVVLVAGLEMPPWQELADSLPHSVYRSQSPHNPILDGNSGPPGGWRRSFCGRRCGLASVTVPGHCCLPNTDLWLLRH